MHIELNREQVELCVDALALLEGVLMSKNLPTGRLLAYTQVRESLRDSLRTDRETVKKPEGFDG